jgi:hypothetical protein
MSTTTTALQDELELIFSEIDGETNCNDLASQYDLGAIEQREIERHFGVTNDTPFDKIDSSELYSEEVSKIQESDFSTVMTFRYNNDQMDLKKHTDKIFMIVGNNPDDFEIIGIR